MEIAEILELEIGDKKGGKKRSKQGATIKCNGSTNKGI